MEEETFRMPAFQSYAGSYEFDGAKHHWRCYATTRVLEIRSREHDPCPPAPHGCKWVRPTQRSFEPPVACLVEAIVDEFSLMLVQVQSQDPGVQIVSAAA